MPAHPRVHCNRGSAGVGFLCKPDVMAFKFVYVTTRSADISMFSIDIGNNSFQLVGLGERGLVVQQKV